MEDKTIKAVFLAGTMYKKGGYFKKARNYNWGNYFNFFVKFGINDVEKREYISDLLIFFKIKHRINKTFIYINTRYELKLFLHTIKPFMPKSAHKFHKFVEELIEYEKKQTIRSNHLSENIKKALELKI